MSALTNVKRFKTQKERLVVRFILIALSSAVLLFALFTVWTSIFTEPDGAGPETPSPYGTIGQLAEPEFFKQAYLSANGGLEHLNSLQTLRLIGRIESGETQIEFFALKRRPDMMLMTYKIGREELTFGTKAGEFWLRTAFPGQPDQLSPVPLAQKKELEKSVPMYGPILAAYLDGQGEVESIRSIDWQGQECLLVVVVAGDPADERRYFVVDSQRLYILAELLSEEPSSALSLYRDYREINQVGIPFLIENLGEGAPRVQLSSVKFNVGASSSVFQP